MTAPKREPGSNYIGLLHEEETKMQRVADISATAKQSRHHIRGLMAAMFSRRSEVR